MDIDQIYFIEQRDEELIVHTETDTYNISDTLINIKSTLPNNFYYANPNTIINDDKVEEYNYIKNYILFNNGYILPKLIKKFNIF